MKSSKQTFPKTLYIVHEVDGDDSYFVAHETLDTLDEERVVASYTLASTNKLTVTRKLG